MVRMGDKLSQHIFLGFLLCQMLWPLLGGFEELCRCYGIWGAGLLQERGESSEQRPWASFKTGRAIYYLFRKSLNQNPI